MGRGSRAAVLRRQNLSAILKTVHVRGPLSRAELGTECGLSRNTVGVLVTELVARRLVVELPPERLGFPGRPSPVVAPDVNGVRVGAVEIGVEGLTVLVAGLGGAVHARDRVDWHGIVPTPEEVANEVVALLSNLIASQYAERKLAGVGVAVHGLVRRADGFVAFAPNLGWHNVPFGAVLQRRLPQGVPVFVGNEADLGALAEHMRGAGVGSQDSLYVGCEVGVGGGIISRGRPYEGVKGYAGEVGHMTINPVGHPCRCGSLGCWETEVGEEALLRRIGPLGATATKTLVEDVLREADAGDRRVLAGLDEHGRWVGIGLSGLANMLNPDRIILGGLFSRMFPYVEERIRWEMNHRCLEAVREQLEVVPAFLGPDSAVLGAAELALTEVLSDPWRLPRAGGRQSMSAIQTPAVADAVARSSMKGLAS